RIVLTATATAATREEIARRLSLEDAAHFVSSFDRPNILYRIVEKNDVKRQLLNFIREEHMGDSGIIYCLSRSRVEDMAAFLSQNGIPALPYHAGIDAARRAEHQARFLREEGLVMTAIIAFVIGVNKPDVRLLAHTDLPNSVEGYYQQPGRAGWDGEPATASVAYGLQDELEQRRMIDEYM